MAVGVVTYSMVVRDGENLGQWGRGLKMVDAVMADVGGAWPKVSRTKPLGILANHRQAAVSKRKKGVTWSSVQMGKALRTCCLRV